MKTFSVVLENIIWPKSSTATLKDFSVIVKAYDEGNAKDIAAKLCELCSVEDMLSFRASVVEVEPMVD